MPLVGEAHRDAVVCERPKLFDEAVFELFHPLASEKGDDVFSAIHKLRAVSPARIESISQGDFFRVARIPTILSETYLLDRGLAGKWG